MTASRLTDASFHPRHACTCQVKEALSMHLPGVGDCYRLHLPQAVFKQWFGVSRPCLGPSPDSDITMLSFLQVPTLVQAPSQMVMLNSIVDHGIVDHGIVDCGMAMAKASMSARPSSTDKNREKELLTQVGHAASLAVEHLRAHDAASVVSDCAPVPVSVSASPLIRHTKRQALMSLHRTPSYYQAFEPSCVSQSIVSTHA